MSGDFSPALREAFRMAQQTLEGLLQVQRKVKACADALKDTHDVKAYAEIAEAYVKLLDEWDVANSRYSAANAVLLKLLHEE